MVNNELSILLVEDNETHALLVCRHIRKVNLSQPMNTKAVIEQAASLGDALTKISTGSYDVILLDLSLPDSPIGETLGKVVETCPTIAVIVLTSLNDLDFATKALQQGAQDYLVKSELNSEILARAIRYAVERKRSQQQLQQYAMKLEESNKHLESFAHTLAHEIRSPLTAISGCLQIIESSHANEMDENTRQMIQDSLTAVSGMTELIEALLNFSQSGSGNRSFEPVELESVFYHVYAMLRRAIKDADATLSHDFLPTVQGNEVQIRQLLQNLIVNAIKYKSPEPLKIHVACHDESDDWVISVMDNGTGIAESDQEKIFSAFTRLECASHISGVGIGLAFCKRIVENHNGKLWVKSKLGVGSTFYFSLPKPHNS